MEFVFPGRSCGGYFRNEKRTGRDSGNSEEQTVFLVMNLMVLYRRKAKAFFAALMETLFELVRKSLTTQILQPMAA
jgi:hypothetical protein